MCHDPRALPLALFVLLFATACQRETEPPVQQALDVVEEIAEGQREVTDARVDAALDPTLDDSPAEAAEATYRIRTEKAEAEHDVARQLCDAIQDAMQQEACFEDALEQYEAAMEKAENKRRALAGRNRGATASDS
ncbi:hypothetical protein [Panacagrimonas sp.]|uniref:hypothetical protein n=1 Tax=Panacagrimonas sp. TaxID=2480088 RepID=UPI003B52AC4F